MTYTIPALTLTDAQVDTIERLTDSNYFDVFVKPYGSYISNDVIVSHSDDFTQFEWIIAADGSYTQLSRALDADGWFADAPDADDFYAGEEIL